MTISNTSAPPLNEATGKPYFAIPAEGWGEGWSAGEPQGIVNYETGDYVYRAPGETVEQMRARYSALAAKKKSAEAPPRQAG